MEGGKKPFKLFKLFKPFEIAIKPSMARYATILIRFHFIATIAAASAYNARRINLPFVRRQDLVGDTVLGPY